jgi:hypothetical protein
MIPFEGHLRRIVALHLDQISGTDMQPLPHTMCRCANEIDTVIISDFNDRRGTEGRQREAGQRLRPEAFARVGCEHTTGFARHALKHSPIPLERWSI